MPFYKISEMETIPTAVGNGAVQMTAGELMKAAMVTYRMGDGPPPHFHPNEEQFILMLEGKFNMILGDDPHPPQHAPRHPRPRGAGAVFPRQEPGRGRPHGRGLQPSGGRR